jgi:hypothetical protein
MADTREKILVTTLLRRYQDRVGEVAEWSKARPC